jgi:Tol biopolymer transport system component
MKKISSVAGSVLVVLAVVAAAGHSTALQAPPPINETVVYSSIQPANWDLYVFDSPGATPRRLTTDSALDYSPAISPDGRWVVFTSERGGGPDLYALDFQNPAVPKRLTKSPAMEDAAAFSPDGRRLAFVSTESGNPDIRVMPFMPDDPEAAAARAINVTSHPAGDYQPAFSPDGQSIVFSSNRDAPGAQGASPEVAGTYQASDVYVMRADGTGVQRLTRHEGWDGSPTWTPDGQGIVFYSEQDGEPRIFRMNRDGSASQAISTKGEAALSPTFTHDGRLSFTVRRSGRWTIVSTRPDGSDLRVESDTARDYLAPAYHPSSGRVVCYGAGPTDEASRFETDLPGPFLARVSQQGALPDRTLRMYAVRGYIPALSPDASEVATGEAFSRLVISRLDGSRKRTIFDRVKTERYRGENSAWGPAWSADGAWLAFGVGAPFGSGSEKVDIWKSRPDGSQAVNLTPDSAANDAWPDFSPDGRRIVFRSARDGNQEIYLMNADGTGVRRLTEHQATDTMPAFSSRGDRVAFTSQRDGGDYEIYLLQLNADGSPAQLERVTNSPGRDMHPRFSPDDKWLLFTSQRGGLNDELPLLRVIFLPQPYGELHAIRLEDKTVFRLTHDKWEDGPSAWKR